MSLQQAVQLAITILFVAVLIELLLALTFFHVRMFREDRQRRKAKRREEQSHDETEKGKDT